MPPVLIAILVAGIALRLPYLTSPFERVEEWGCSMFSLYAQNYDRFGFLECGLYPVYGKVGAQPFPYVNHPPGGALMLGLWTQLFGHSEASSRILAILTSTLTIALLYLLASKLFDKKVGLWTAGFYAFMPLSIYMGRVYSMEPPEYLFFIGCLYTTLRWHDGDGNRWLVWAALSLGLSNAMDFYPIYSTPVFGLLALLEKDNSKRWGWLLLAMLSPALIGLHLFYVHWWGWLGSMGQGASKYGKPWEYWILPAYYTSVGKRLFTLFGFLPTLLVPLALWRARLGWDRRQAQILALFWSHALFDFLILGRALMVHNYRVLFFAGPIALTAAWWLAQRPAKLQVGAALLFVGLSIYPTVELFEANNSPDHRTAATIRKKTTEKDILIGLPPHISYYVSRPSIVPYFYLWKHQDLYTEPERLFAELHPFAAKKEYDYIVLFTKFLTTDSSVDFEWFKAFDGLDNLERVTQPGQDPQIWKFVRPDQKKTPAE